MAEYLVQDTDLQQVADAIKEKAGITGTLTFPDGFSETTRSLVKLPTLSNKGIASDLASGKQLIGASGEIITGSVAVASNTYSGFEYTNASIGTTPYIVDGDKFTEPKDTLANMAAPETRILYKTCIIDSSTGKIVLSNPLSTAGSDAEEQLANYSAYSYFYGDLGTGSSDSNVYKYTSLTKTNSTSEIAGVPITFTYWHWTYYQQLVYFDLDINFKATEDVIIRNTKTGKVAISSSDFGIAKPEDVVVGKTFTSANGFKIMGTHECSGDSGNITLPEIADDVLGSASDLASGKQLIGADGNIIVGEATILKSGSIAHGVAVNNITVGSYYGTSTNVTVVRYKEVKPVDGVITAGPSSNTGGINEESESSSVFSSEYRYIKIDDAWYYTPATATLAVTGTSYKTVKFSGINPVFILA